MQKYLFAMMLVVFTSICSCGEKSPPTVPDDSDGFGPFTVSVGEQFELPDFELRAHELNNDAPWPRANFLIVGTSANTGPHGVGEVSYRSLAWAREHSRIGGDYDGLIVRVLAIDGKQITVDFEPHDVVVNRHLTTERQTFHLDCGDRLEVRDGVIRLDRIEHARDAFIFTYTDSTGGRGGLNYAGRGLWLQHRRLGLRSESTRLTENGIEFEAWLTP